MARRGRKPLPKSQLREHKVQIRLSGQEARILAEAHKGESSPLSTWIRELALAVSLQKIARKKESHD